MTNHIGIIYYKDTISQERVIHMTNEEWLKLDEKDAVLSDLQRQYKKPRYDPFEAFQPPKAFIKEVIKQLNNHPYAKTQYIYEIETEWGFIPKQVAEARAGILRRINQYKYYLQGGVNKSDVGEAEIRRAKEYPITDLYGSMGRRTGRNIVGKCPFHDDRSPSFTIFTDKNTWRCFGCSTGGDSLDYIIKRDNISFIEAVKFLLR